MNRRGKLLSTGCGSKLDFQDLPLLRVREVGDARLIGGRFPPTHRFGRLVGVAGVLFGVVVIRDDFDARSSTGSIKRRYFAVCGVPMKPRRNGGWCGSSTTG